MLDQMEHVGSQIQYLKNIKEQQQNPIEGSSNFLKIPKLYKNSKIKNSKINKL